MTATTCSKCGGPRPSPTRRYCRACHAEWMRLHRLKHSALPPPEKAKANCRAYANAYQRRGKLRPQPCELCGAAVAEKHHDDYTRPLDVRWFCRKCHRTFHTESAFQALATIVKQRISA